MRDAIYIIFPFSEANVLTSLQSQIRVRNRKDKLVNHTLVNRTITSVPSLVTGGAPKRWTLLKVFCLFWIKCMWTKQCNVNTFHGNLQPQLYDK